MAELLSAVRFTSTVELRLDWLRSDPERKKFLTLLRRFSPRKLTLIATCRRILGGGKLAGGAQAELFWLTQAREAGCQWCDLEIETLRELPQRSARGFPIPEKILLSMHDFQKTPQLPPRLLPSLKGEADAFKIAALATSLRESLQLTRLASGSKNIVAVPMGETGLPARLLALRRGSALAYAPVAAATAPGQVSLADFKRLYRADAISAKTKIYGVIGNPIGHSLSPLLHNSGFASAKRDAVYLPFLVENLKDFLQSIPEFGLRGFSVTLPHKQALMKHLAGCESAAEKIGAINTVVVDRLGKLHGSNTDYLGVLRALQGKLQLSGSLALIFGAGGSARAAAFALAGAGAQILICARRLPAARELARACGGEAIPRKHLASTKFELIVNATPVGMFPNPEHSPLLPGELNCHVLLDLIYRPMRTTLLHLAGKKGIRAVSGVEMFLAQGFAQWELWTGTKAPEAAMRRAVLAQLRKDEVSRTKS